MSKLSVVGIGPGSFENMTQRAQQALADCDVIVGYTVYVELVKAHYADREFLTTPMRKEVERCELAFERAAAGKNVAMICSGDAGVYGMASLVLELADEYGNPEVEVIPGVTAALSGSALLGAPLGHDFAVISLSDLLTPWDLIEKRLACAAAGRFCIALYNPSSKKRSDYLRKACDILLEHLPPDTLCGLARNVGRSGETARILDLKALRDTPVDMFTTVFIGNTHTREISGRMVTPRGYRFG